MSEPMDTKSESSGDVAMESSNGNEEKSFKNWDELAANMKVSDLLLHKADPKTETPDTFLTIRSDLTIRRTLDTLNVHDLIALPVTHYETGKFLGFVDVLDIMAFLLSTWRIRGASIWDPSHFPAAKFFETPIAQVINFSGQDGTYVIRESASIGELIHLFCIPVLHRRLHRVAVISSGGQGKGKTRKAQKSEEKIINVLTQSDLVALLFRQRHLLSSELLKGTVKSLHLSRPCISVRLDSPFVDALDTLVRNHISGLALTDHEFHFSGSFSASDLRGAKLDTFTFFDHSVTAFLAKGTSSRGKGPAIRCGVSSTLEEVLRFVVTERIHRIFVSDEFDHPIGVISLGDILTLVNFEGPTPPSSLDGDDGGSSSSSTTHKRRSSDADAKDASAEDKGPAKKRRRQA